MQVQEEAAIIQRLGALRLEHRQLDGEIASLIEARCRDELLLSRMKKRKLALKDCIARLESQLIPNLDA